MMRVLPPPIIVEHDGIKVVRDDFIDGGTKRRVLHVFFDEHDAYVYASPVQGAAQIALAYAARDHGKRAIIFCAERKTNKHPNTLKCMELGASVVEVPMGFLSNVTAKAKAFCEQNAYAKLLPFGLDDPIFIAALAEEARLMNIAPEEVWSITSSGVLSRALQLAWPSARFFGVRVGHPPDAGIATVYEAPERFEQDARMLPPFPSCLTYDAKAWQFIKRHASPGALFWNVSA